MLHIISEQPVRYDSRGCIAIVWQVAAVVVVVVVVVDDDNDDKDNDGDDDCHRDNDR